jgi:tagatose-6-phosphate ketose/aldose isomerase
VINEQTLVVYFLSNNNYVRQYEKDLISSMKDGNHVMLCLAVGDDQALMPETDEQINFGRNGEKIHEDFLPVCSIIAGQLLGFYKSLALGLSPDNPSVNGAISRVVQGVKIYPVEAQIQTEKI